MALYKQVHVAPETHTALHVLAASITVAIGGPVTLGEVVQLAVESLAHRVNATSPEVLRAEIRALRGDFS